MLRFHAASFACTMGEIRGAVHALTDLSMKNWEWTEKLKNEHWEVVDRCIRTVSEEVKELPLSFSLKEQIKRTQAAAVDRRDFNIPVLITLLTEIYNNIGNELTQHLFLMIPHELANLFANSETLAGDEVTTCFPNATKDIHHGVRCFVLDQWTASVFHFMRVLEHGIRSVCSIVEIPTENIQLENWKNILDQIEKKIREIEQLPRSNEKVETLKFLSEAAVNFRYFKDAWRNHVAHSREHYDSSDAKRVMEHVLDFMRQLAKRIKCP